MISPFDLGIAYHYFLKPEEVLECLRLYVKSLDKRKDVLERSIHTNKKKCKEYRVIALFSRPLAHVEAEKEWVEQFISTVEQERLNRRD